MSGVCQTVWCTLSGDKDLVIFEINRTFIEEIYTCQAHLHHCHISIHTFTFKYSSYQQIHTLSEANFDGHRSYENLTFTDLFLFFCIIEMMFKMK